MSKINFYSMNLKQPVNQWLCIGLMVSWCIWIVVYYVKNDVSTVFANTTAISQQLIK